jgi:hypothetical protein
VIDIEKVIKDVSKNLDIDKELVSTVCKHVFQSVVDTMKDEEDTRDILFNQAFKFKLKRRYKESKQKQYSSK